MKKSSYRHLSGVFLLNKPLGLSSNSALQKVRRLFNAQKAGHTGALDPLATGLLPICLGEATKFSHYLLDSTKRYQTTVKLGQTTATGDVEGEILQQRDVPALTEANIEQVLEQFRGDIKQVPPMYSALKREGRPLYELARQGIEIEREARPVTIYELKLLSFTEDSLTLDVTCSKGTYIRVLGEDIGEALGCGGHLTKLHRTQTGHFEINPSYTIEYLEGLTQEQRDALLLPVYAPVEHFPRVQLPEGREKYFGNGQESNIEHEAAAEVLVFDGERCLGLAEITDKKASCAKTFVEFIELVLMEWELILSLVFFAFCAGTIDAAVGGGGLIQIPALMGALPQTAPATLFGTNKLASIFGTGSAAFSFVRRVKLQWSLLWVIAIFAFVSAYVGAACVSLVPTHILRPIVLVMLIVIAIYTFMKKQFGQVHVDQHITPKLLFFAALGSLAIGFYDGIFGPGTGSFFIFFFIRFLQVDFLHASALSKIGNFMTNLAALSFFIPAGHIFFQLGFMMAAANIAGSLLGVRLALKYGSGFIRILFLILVSILICRLAYQIFVAV